MTTKSTAKSKLTMQGGRTRIPVAEAVGLVSAILGKAGFPDAVARGVAQHLVDADLCGVESHGIVRTLQYVEQIESGYLRPRSQPTIRHGDRGTLEVDGGGGIGIPAMQMAVKHLCAEAARSGFAVLPVRNVGHTGRLGAYAEAGAETGALIIIIGGGGRRNWRQVAPHGGRKALLPTNPYCLGMPGGARGPVVIDFATSMIAGGWLYSARAAGALVPEGAIIDAEGRASRDPHAYFDGGAILPKGGPMGYGMAVMAEMICEAMLGPVEAECNWLTMAVDTKRFREPGAIQRAAEEVLDELRNCPPAPGFERVEIPGERERDQRRANLSLGIAVPDLTVERIRSLASRIGAKA